VLLRKCKENSMSVIMAAHSISAWPDWDAKRYQLKDGRLESASEAFAQARDINYNRKFSYAK